MILWTIQPEEVFDIVMKNGVYHCDTEIVREKRKKFILMQYDWLAAQIRKRIGPPPEGVNYPVWSWRVWDKERGKPDLRAIRWYWNQRGKKYYRLEIDIPDKDVLLLDRNSWDVILNECLLSDSENEDNVLEKIYKALSPDEKIIMRDKNWERLFNLEPSSETEYEWSGRGEIIEAVFWELKRENIRNITSFVSHSKYN